MENQIFNFILFTDDIRMTVSNYGCTIIKLETVDKNGDFQNMVVTLKDKEDYLSQDKLIGAVVGRFANRIGGAEYSLDGKTYKLSQNNGENHIHGGFKGFNQRIFDYKINQNQAVFTYHSPDGEEGYPGNLDLKVKYTLENRSLIIDYTAKSDRDTIVNLTNHSYFTLGGDSGEKLSLQINADYYVENDENSRATGKHINVEDTAFDFRKMKRVGQDINQNDPQLIGAKGYDHAFKLKGESEQIRLYNEENGIEMTVSTDMPYTHIYSANYLGGEKGENGRIYRERDAICLETEALPDGINNGYPERIILRAGEIHKSRTVFSFNVKK